MIITISGPPGSGKTSVAKALAKTMNAKFYSAGDTRRKYAEEHGMTIEELNKKAVKDPASDLLVDEELKRIGQTEDNMIVDARLGFHFIPNSIKVLLTVDENVAAERIMHRTGVAEKHKDLKETKASALKRVEGDKKRYKALYQVDPYDESNFDLVIDGTTKPCEKIAGDIYRFARFKEHRLN